MLLGKFAQVGQVFFCKWAGFGGQVAQKVDHMLGCLGHLGHDREFTKVVKAQQLCFFQAQGQHLTDDGRVVKLVHVHIGLVRGARHVGPVQFFAQGATFGKLHDGKVARHFEGELKTLFALGLGRFKCGLLHIGGYAVQFIGLCVIRKRIGGVQRVFAELLAQLGLALGNSGKALTGFALQLGTAQDKVAHGIFVGLALLGVERGHVNGFVFGIQPLVGTQSGEKFGDFGQRLVVGGAQLGRIGHAVEVAHGAPGAAEFFGGHIQHGGNIRPAGGEVSGRDRFKRSAGTGQQQVNSRCDVVGLDLVKKWQIVKGE